MRSARHALFPMLIAERDREYLKQIRRNRDEEERLMSGVEGWKVSFFHLTFVFCLNLIIGF